MSLKSFRVFFCFGRIGERKAWRGGLDQILKFQLASDDHVGRFELESVNALANPDWLPDRDPVRVRSAKKLGIRRQLAS